MTKLVWFLAFIVSATANDIQGVLPMNNEAEPKLIIDPMPIVELSKSEPLKETEKSKELEETMLRPIGPIFPSFLQPAGLFGQAPFEDPMNTNEESLQEGNGILTIILFHSKNDDDLDASNNDVKKDQPISNEHTNFKDSAKASFRSLKQFILHDLFGQEIEESHQTPHLLGGRDDPDHFIKYGGDNNDFIRFVRGDEMPILSDDLGRHSELFDYQKNNEKCNFMRLLKLKAQIHYRTIVHLIFISGLILVILMMISLTIRVNKRKNALRRYGNKHIHISSIDSALAKQKEAQSYSPVLGRLGSLKSSYEQKMAPPAYEQINENVSNVHSSRYQRLSSGNSQDEEDRKSISSLPPYEEKSLPKI